MINVTLKFINPLNTSGIQDFDSTQRIGSELTLIGQSWEILKSMRWSSSLDLTKGIVCFGYTYFQSGYRAYNKVTIEW
jgi:hypothetical protein